MDLDFFDSYSITACRIDCETRYLVENCNCRMVHMPGEALGPSARRGGAPPLPPRSPCRPASRQQASETSWLLLTPVPAVYPIWFSTPGWTHRDW